MKNLNYLNQYRQDVRHIYGTNGDEYNGAFKVYVNGRSFFEGRPYKHGKQF